MAEENEDKSIDELDEDSDAELDEDSDAELDEDSDAEEEKEEKPERKKLDRRQLKSLGKKHLIALAEKLRLDLEVDAENTREGVRFDISGDDARVYLLAGGRSPQKLDAVQTWLRAALENDGDTRGKDIDVDVEGFRQEREERLVRMAKVLARDAKRIDREVLVAGLNSFERRIVHRSLDDVGGVTTESTGRGSFRKLRVEPE